MPANGNPTPPLIGGNNAVSQILESYVFQSGIHKPEMSQILSIKYPQYLMTSLLDRLGASEGKAQSVFTWDTLDRTRNFGVVKNQSGNTTATVTFEIPEYAFTAAKPGYLIVGDTIRFESGALGIIQTSVISTTLSDVQKVTATRVGGEDWTAADVANDFKFGHAFSLFGEGTDQPIGRIYLPTEDENRFSLIKRSIKITGAEITNKTWLGDNEAWYWTIEDIVMDEFARDRENAIMFGKISTSSVYASRGILDWALNEGITNVYSSAAGVSEADLRDHIREMLVEGTSNEITVLCGSKFLSSVQVALRDYAVNGGISYGSFGMNTAGLDFQSYKFLGKTIQFAHYVTFDDAELLPFSDTPTSIKSDFSDFSLWLDLGTDNGGKKLITLIHKEHDGSSRKFIHAVKPGMMSPSGANGGIVSSGFDGFEVFYLSEISVEVRLPNRLGVLYATS